MKLRNGKQSRGHWLVARALYATIKTDEAVERCKMVEAKLLGLDEVDRPIQ